MKSQILFVLGLFAFFSSPVLSQTKVKTREAISFQTKEIKVGGVVVKVEIADTPEKTARGLMFRTSLDEGQGMLFIFPNEDYRSFWMRNTFIPLSIGFFDRNKKLIDIQDMEPVKSEMETNPPSYASAAPAKYALEVPRGWFEKKKIKIGSSLSGL